MRKQQPKSKILLADDNDDMRDYIRRLLSVSYHVQTVADGVAAWNEIQKDPPDLVLTDAMMSGIDGFELLRSIRSNPTTQDIPIILLSERAGEEALIEGLKAGADDYLIKPFSARELLARVEASLKLARLRQEATLRERTILGRVTDAFMALDSDFRFTYANEAAQRVARTSLEALLGKTMWESFPGTIGNQFEFQYRRSLTEQIPVEFEEYYAPFDLWVEVRVYPSPTGLSLFFRDISDRKRTQLNAAFLDNLSQDLIKATRVDEIVQTVGSQLNRYLNISTCAFVEIDQKKDEAVINYNWHQSDVPNLVGVYSLREFVTDEFMQAAKAGQAIVVQDVNTDPRLADRSRYAALKIGAEINIPLIRNGEWKFLLTVFHQQPYNWREDELELMRVLANRIWAKLERAFADAALRESEEKYRNLFDSIDEGYFIGDVIFDEDDRPIDIFYLEANPAVLRITGLDLVGRRLREIDPNYESHWWETFGRVARTGVGERQELYAAPMKAWYNFYAFKVGDADSHRVAVVFQDVSDRKKAERERERFLALGSDFQVITGINGYFHWVSPTFEQLLGWTPEEMTSRPWTEFVHPDDINISVAETESLFAGNQTFRFENRYRHKDGSYRWLLWNAQPYPEEQVIYGAAVDISDRKKAEAAAQEASTRFRNMADSAPVLIWQTDEAGVTYVNRHYLEFFAQTLDSVKGMGWANFLHPEDAAAYIQAYRTAFERQERYEFPCRFLRHDGEYRWLQNVGEAHYGLDRTFLGFVGCSVDVTDIKAVETILQESEERFRNMADNAPMMVWVTDATGYCTYLSRSWYEFSGQTEATGLGFGWLDATHPGDRETSKAIFLTAKDRQEAFQLEYRLRHKDGAYRTCIDAAKPWFGADGEFKGYIGSVIDIDDRKQAEAALRQSEERYRTLFESIDEGFCIVEMIFDSNNTPIDYRFVEINPVFEEQTGLRQAVGKTARELVPNLENYWVEIYGQVALTGEPVRFENGSQAMNRWFDVYACRTGEPEARKVAIVFKDISDRKRIEQEREQILQREQATREQAERANRIKDEFLAVLSHELRSPLNPILGWSRLLRTGKLNATKTTDALEIIERNAKLQVQLIDDLLDISRILRGKLTLNVTPVDLSTVILQALETVRLAAEAKSLQIQTTISPDVGAMMGDAGRLQQVVWNLLSNAVKFTPSGGQVEVNLKKLQIEDFRFQIERELQIEDENPTSNLQSKISNLKLNKSAISNTKSNKSAILNLKSEISYAQIQVSDTGKGINPEFLPYVFEHFRQEDSAITRKFGGLGLGLAIARQIVELHGGRIWVESPGEGQGATFTVELPLLQAANPVEEVRDSNLSQSDDLPLANLRVLVVDDEVDSREFVAFVVEQAGAEVTAVSSAIEALQTFRSATFDIILSDIGMPLMDGYALMREIRQLPKDRGGKIGAIALTAYAGEIDRQQALNAGFGQHISKPIDSEQLMLAIADLIKNKNT